MIYANDDGFGTSLDGLTNRNASLVICINFNPIEKPIAILRTDARYIHALQQNVTEYYRFRFLSEPLPAILQTPYQIPSFFKPE